MRVFISHPFFIWLPEQKFGCNEMEIFGTSSRDLIAINLNIEIEYYIDNRYKLILIL